jgi:hypothetical protein
MQFRGTIQYQPQSGDWITFIEGYPISRIGATQDEVKADTVEVLAGFCGVPVGDIDVVWSVLIESADG